MSYRSFVANIVTVYNYKERHNDLPKMEILLCKINKCIFQTMKTLHVASLVE